MRKVFPFLAKQLPLLVKIFPSPQQPGPPQILANKTVTQSNSLRFLLALIMLLLISSKTPLPTSLGGTVCVVGQPRRAVRSRRGEKGSGCMVREVVQEVRNDYRAERIDAGTGEKSFPFLAKQLPLLVQIFLSPCWADPISH